MELPAPPPDEADVTPWWLPGADIEVPVKHPAREAVGVPHDDRESDGYWLGIVVGFVIGFVFSMMVVGLCVYYGIRLVTDGG